MSKCTECNGTGYEICDNPDHRLIEVIGGETGRIGCPLCGHDEQHRIISNKCSVCKGTGIAKEKEPSWEYKVTEAVTMASYRWTSNEVKIAKHEIQRLRKQIEIAEMQLKLMQERVHLQDPVYEIDHAVTTYAIAVKGLNKEYDEMKDL